MFWDVKTAAFKAGSLPLTDKDEALHAPLSVRGLKLHLMSFYGLFSPFALFAHTYMRKATLRIFFPTALSSGTRWHYLWVKGCLADATIQVVCHHVVTPRSPAWLLCNTCNVVEKEHMTGTAWLFSLMGCNMYMKLCISAGFVASNSLSCLLSLMKTENIRLNTWYLQIPITWKHQKTFLWRQSIKYKSWNTFKNPSVLIPGPSDSISISYSKRVKRWWRLEVPTYCSVSVFYTWVNTASAFCEVLLITPVVQGLREVQHTRLNSEYVKMWM